MSSASAGSRASRSSGTSSCPATPTTPTFSTWWRRSRPAAALAPPSTPRSRTWRSSLRYAAAPPPRPAPSLPTHPLMATLAHARSMRYAALGSGFSLTPPPFSRSAWCACVCVCVPPAGKARGGHCQTARAHLHRQLPDALCHGQCRRHTSTSAAFAPLRSSPPLSHPLPLPLPRRPCHVSQDLDVLKLTAQFVAKNGSAFLHQLMEVCRHTRAASARRLPSPRPLTGGLSLTHTPFPLPHHARSARVPTTSLTFSSRRT